MNNCSRARDLLAPDVGISTQPASQTSKTNQTNVRAQSIIEPIFVAKTLDQYPNLYREFSRYKTGSYFY